MPENFTTLVANPLIDPAVGTWTQIAGGSATIVSPNSNLTQILDMEPGVYEFVWTINNGPCWDSADTMSIVVYEEVIPEADAGSNQEFCSPVSSTTLEGNTPVYPAFGTWSLVGSNDEESINIVDPSDPLTEVTGLSVGENIFAWTVYNGPCSEFDPYYIDFVTIYISFCALTAISR